MALPPTYWSPEQVRRLAALVADGVPDQEIADEFKRAVTQIKSKIWRLQLPGRTAPQTTIWDDHPEAGEIVESLGRAGMSSPAIVAALAAQGIVARVAQVTGRLNKLGLRRRPIRAADPQHAEKLAASRERKLAARRAARAAKAEQNRPQREAEREARLAATAERRRLASKQRALIRRREAKMRPQLFHDDPGLARRLVDHVRLGTPRAAMAKDLGVTPEQVATRIKTAGVAAIYRAAQARRRAAEKGAAPPSRKQAAAAILKARAPAPAAQPAAPLVEQAEQTVVVEQAAPPPARIPTPRPPLPEDLSPMQQLRHRLVLMAGRPGGISAEAAAERLRVPASSIRSVAVSLGIHLLAPPPKPPPPRPKRLGVYTFRRIIR